MKTLALVLLFLSSTLINAYSSISGNEQKVELFKLIAGEYGNIKGAEASVSLSLLESDPDEPSLFGPENFSFELSYDEQEYGYYFELDEDDFDSQTSDGSLVFSTYENDCDNPGCSNYEFTFTFQKKSDGSYYLIVKGSFSTDAEDLSWQLSEDENFKNASDSEQEKMAELACKDYYGETATLSYLDGDYYDDYRVYCDHEVTTYLKKL